MYLKVILVNVLFADIMHSFNILSIEVTLGFLDRVKLLSSV